MTGETLAHYEIGPLLGKGGMGEVYRAHDTTLDRDVAIKVLPAELAGDAERLARFRREAKVLASLNHPHIAGIHGLEESGGRSFLVMELAEGEDLAQRLARGPVQLDDALAIARQIAEGLEEAHEKGIVHRDLKPANVMVAPDGKVKILDFGLARAYLGETLAEGDPAFSPTITAGLTQAGVILGSAAYMSPEQAKGSPVDRRTDIWAFGVILYEMITGRSLFGADTISESMASVLKEPIDWEALPADLPPGIRALLERCLERDPRLRLRDIGEARIHLQDPHGSVVLAASSSAPGLAPIEPDGRRWRTVLPWALLGAACLAFVLAWTRADHGANGAAGIGIRVVRSSLESPPGTGFQLTCANPAAMAISPDGTRVVYGARDEQGSHQLWLQDLAAPAPVPVAGTEGAQYPFWSPDGRSVGYFADGSLRVVDLEGRTNRAVAPASDGKGGCWLPDGTILFTENSTAGIQRVAADGGTAPVEVTRLDAEPRANSHRLPRPLPDGQHFLFAARTLGLSDEEPIAVMIGSLDGSPSRRLINANGQAEFAAGHLLYVSGSSLFARPFDPDALAFTGPPVQLADDVGVIPGAALALFSAAPAGNLVYHPGHRETLAIRLIWYDAAGTVLGELGESAGYGSFDLSPDGTQLVFTTYDNRLGAGDIWLHDIERDVRTRLTFETADEAYPVWAPDGKTIYYVRTDADGAAILAFRPDSRDPARTVYSSPEIQTFEDVSPDGRTLAFTVRDTVANTMRAVVMPLDGSQPPQPVDDGSGMTLRPRFSPDGRWIAYASRESGRWEIFLKTFPLSSRKWQLADREAFWFEWHPDGDEICFQWSGTELSAVDVDLSGATPRIGATQVLFDDFPTPVTSLHDFAITGDGQRILVSDAGGTDDSRPARLVQGWTRITTAAERIP